MSRGKGQVTTHWRFPWACQRCAKTREFLVSEAHTAARGRQPQSFGRCPVCTELVMVTPEHRRLGATA